MRNLVFVAMGLLAASPVAAVNLISNGSFETGPVPGSFQTYGTGSTQISGWTVTAGSIDYIGTYWNAADGIRSLDLSGNSAGTIAQSFATVAGQSYTVSFAMSGNPDRAGNKSVRVSVAGVSNDFTHVGVARPLVWTSQSFGFTAVSSLSTLSFASLTAGSWGVALDDVQVTQIVPLAVPEPQSWLMLLAGFGATGMLLRRRRVAAA